MPWPWLDDFACLQVFLVRKSTSEERAYVISTRYTDRYRHHIIHLTRSGHWRIDSDVRKFSNKNSPPVNVPQLIELMQAEKVVPLPRLLGTPVLQSSAV